MIGKQTAEIVKYYNNILFLGGYGSTLLNTMRCGTQDIEFPLILGRDFTGTIVQKGLGIKNADLKIGSKVWGVVPVHQHGCHAEYVSVNQSCVGVCFM